ncbi:hypothetical protein P154DRAFT_490935 [Amniculicola lignicola CBS 123094]|uniref:DUF4267 domain-containing protein n=1 Tax=Amniculicola lignicola CBS 123094 TaxID=1392246 RepID=A0A6A5WHH5_9PLEO|nr:hypothetical protein P154DRAFT_490935 [Amniculicola lignicola CBS 123094]
MPLSTHTALPLLSSFFGTIFTGLGLYYILQPRSAFLAFGLPAISSLPSTSASISNDAIMDAVMVMYGARDLFMGVAILGAAWLGRTGQKGRRNVNLGGLLVAGSLCAGVDGWVVRSVVGEGEWNHWGYGGVMGMLGCVVLGIFG